MGHHGACHCGRIGFDVDGDLDRVIECTAIAAVNVRCLDGVEPASLTITKFDGRSL